MLLLGRRYKQVAVVHIHRSPCMLIQSHQEVRLLLQSMEHGPTFLNSERVTMNSCRY